MGIYEVIQKLRELRQAREERPDIPDDVTTDKYLRSLRRERRIQMELLEKRKLKEDIESFRKNEERNNLWGVKGEAKSITHHDFNILSDRRPMMKRKNSFL